jgi:hypothetical protein
LRRALFPVAALVLLFGLLSAIPAAVTPAGAATTPAAPQTAGVVATAGSPVPVVKLPGSAQAFSSYDFNQSALDHVEWPVEFIFRGNVTIQKIEDGLCRLTAGPWKYCAHGADEFLYRPAPTGDFAANDGVKRFSETCADTQFTAHMRLYQVGDDVVGTVHLDFEDHGGCSGSIYGYPDVAEQWFTDAMDTIEGWTLTPKAWDLGNGSAPYVVLDQSHGIIVPYVYGQDSLATDVYIR